MVMMENAGGDVSEAFVVRARRLLSDEYLPKIERCLERLTEEQIWWRANENSNSIGNLVLHVCGNARQWIISGLGGVPDARTRQAEFDARGNVTRADLTKLLRETVAEIDQVLAAFDVRRLPDTFHIQHKDSTALEAIFHVAEHFSMHTGQIILLTKLLTGTDLRFYGFEDGVPVHRWNTPAHSE
jgi:uncharacterized damage-inducible protein DinB